jgi:hypothetical protein
VRAALDKIPSPTMIGILISDQICDYNRKDLSKIAMDIKYDRQGAKAAFHYIYAKIRGWN